MEKIEWKKSILAPSKLIIDTNTFRFLNLEHRFNGKINWNENRHGKLWTYNLNYFEFLLQDDVAVKNKLELIRDFISRKKNIKDGFEPYPISLRTIFTIRFLIENKIKDPEIDQLLFGQLLYLAENIEYHLLGNHLLENGFAFLFGAVYFKDDYFRKIASKTIKEQLDEQILQDGGHFELSPMYHQIILYRLLDSINLLESVKNDFPSGFVDLCKNKAVQMLAWLENMTFSNGDIPMVNDATNDIAPVTSELLAYAGRLGLTPSGSRLKDSGYRMFKTGAWELLADVGNIGPDYIPGHAHADAFGFVLYYGGKPVIVDVGISTYEKNERRQWERSTEAHNTVKVKDAEQTEVWGGFRVGRRAYVKLVSESEHHVEASHNGYRNLGIEHIRKFELGEQGLNISDTLLNNEKFKASAYFHIYPGVKILRNEEYIGLNSLKVSFKGDIYITIEDYRFCSGYNKIIDAQRIRIDFLNKLETRFH